MEECQLPPLFAERLNKLDDVLTRLQGTSKQAEKENLAIEVYCLSCRILASVNPNTLEYCMKDEFQKLSGDYTSLKSLMATHFEGFLSIEMEALEDIGLNDSSRARVAEIIKSVRDAISDKEPQAIKDGIIRLREETCALCRVSKRSDRWIEKIERDPNPGRNWEKVLRVGKSVFGVGVIVVNTAAGVTGFIDHDTAILSCLMGNAVVSSPELPGD